MTIKIKHHMSDLFVLNPNVFFTRGEKRATLFDGNTSSLYWLSPAASRYLSHALSGNSAGDLSSDVKHLLSELDQLGLGICVLPDKSTCQHPERCPDKVEHSLSIAYYEITTVCNLSCIHCYTNSSVASSETAKSHIPDLEDEKHLLKAIASSGVKRIQFIGGEPFLQWDRLQRLCSFALQYFEQVEIFTNGTLLNDRNIISFIKENNITLSISLYSYHAPTHDAITRCQGSHALTIEALTQLKKEKINFHVAFVLMDQNQADMDKTIDFIWRSFGQRVKPKPVRLTGRAASATLNGAVFHKKEITLHNFKGAFESKEFLYNRSFHNCYGRGMYIASDGNVYPCVMERRLSIGNIKTNEWPEILGSTIFSNVIRLNKDKIDVCCGCEFRYLCFDCRPDASGLSANMLSKPWNCTYLPAEGQWSNNEEEKLNMETSIIKLTNTEVHSKGPANPPSHGTS